MYEGQGAEAQKILQDNEGRRDGENLWAPSELAATGTVAGIHDPGGTLSETRLNERMKGGYREQENVRGGSTNGGSTLVPPPIVATVTESTQAGWSVLMAAVDRVGAAATSTFFLQRMLKGQLEVGDDNAKAKDFRAQALELQNLQVFVGMVKGDTELKIFHSMIKYNDMFATNNLSGSVIGFMGDRPLAGRPWVFKIPRDKPWAWPEVECVENAIEMQGHFGQEGNKNTLWDTSGEQMITRAKFPRLAMVPYGKTKQNTQRDEAVDRETR